ncbi:hypothetical protein M9H77_07180 [Catharanthus roseus]|uniref:Uncharacterized protein n=1 Tax=Catharanthus roseus TaxID=4058 RepID=A0ACC0BUC8_CATRO|nr:hypothetical protein M9H77_07180 [Catharanthus roseus]
MFIDDKDEIAPEPKESTFPRSQEPPLSTTIVEESKKVGCLPKNKNEYEEGKLEKENENRVGKTEIDVIEMSEGVNPLTHETNFVLVVDSLCIVVDSLCMQESWKQLKENDKERRSLMKFKGNFENPKRD